MPRACAPLLVVVACLALPVLRAQQSSSRVVYAGDHGPARGKRVVLLAGDEEYRSEETLPALARILARHYGFVASVLFTTDPKTGFIDPASSNISGLETLDSADLLVVFLRFRDFPDAQMEHLARYLDRGGPVVGLRTATHAFQIKRPDARFLRYTWDNTGAFAGGFGRQILGETWVSHYGTNHKQSSRLVLTASEPVHPILRGVKDVWVRSGGYTADPQPDSQVLAVGQILDGMTPDAPPAANKKQMPVAWYRSYASASGRTGRVFTTTHGASEDLLNEGFRRLVVNACLWAAGLDAGIRPDNDVSFVGPYHPSTFAFDGFVRGAIPAALAGWTSPIPAVTRQEGER